MSVPWHGLNWKKITCNNEVISNQTGSTRFQIELWFISKFMCCLTFPNRGHAWLVSNTLKGWEEDVVGAWVFSLYFMGHLKVAAWSSEPDSEHQMSIICHSSGGRHRCVFPLLEVKWMSRSHGCSSKSHPTGTNRHKTCVKALNSALQRTCSLTFWHGYLASQVIVLV